MHGRRIVGHDLADQTAIQDYVASVDPNALAGLAVIVKIQLTRKDERIFAHCRAELRAVGASVFDDKLVDVALASAIGHVHRDHKSHFSIPV
jgi:hypothetical protein